MRKIVFQEFVTIDGFAAGQDGKTSFVDFLVAEGGKEVDKDMLHFIGTIDMILLGAVTYSMFVNYWHRSRACLFSATGRTKSLFHYLLLNVHIYLQDKL